MRLSESGSERKTRVGISSCLLGENVRYDGGHKLDRLLRDILGRHGEFVPVCPEVECGLPVPRPAMGLAGSVETPRLVTVRGGVDHTDRMVAWARRRVRELEAENLSGFIFKCRSPSCGLARVQVFTEPSRTGTGLFARMFTEHFPLLPVEEEARLQDPELRASFFERLIPRARQTPRTCAGRR